MNTTPSYELAISAAQDRALKICKSPQTWEKESVFAAFQVAKSADLQKLAKASPHQLTEAVVQAIASGISLNPVLQLAYLIPRGGKISLEFGYQGYIARATASGAVSDVFVELVYSCDEFKRGVRENVPFIDHVPGVRKPGDECTGGYCLATLPNGRVQVCYMAVDEIEAIRKKGGPVWSSNWVEMAKKTVIRRARKTWPSCQALERIIAAEDAASVDLSEDGAPAVEAEFAEELTPTVIDDDTYNQIRELIDTTSADEEALCRYFDIRGIGDLSPAQGCECLVLLRKKADRGPRP